MFPFRLRLPPTKLSDRRIKRLKKTSDNIALGEDEVLSPPDDLSLFEGGGPIQRALYGDFVDLREEFVSQQNSSFVSQAHANEMSGETSLLLSSSSSSSSQKTVTAFEEFKHVVGRAKVSLLHTRLAPTICDKAAYSQLLYATCFSLLRQTFKLTEDGVLQERTQLLLHASFAIYLLYTLYETNPLKDLDDIPQRETDIMSMLPTSFSYSRDSILKRRQFRRPIRVDLCHYQLLCRLDDLAREQLAICEIGILKKERMKNSYSEDATTALVPDPDVVQLIRSKTLAVDTVHILHLLQSRLDLVAYSGPVGLESLAGHADYPLNAGILTDYSCLWDSPSDESIKFSYPPDHSMILNNDFVETKLRSYQDACSSISFPLNNLTPYTQRQFDRVRETIRPVFDKDNGNIPVLSQLMKTVVHGPSEDSSPTQKTRIITLKRRQVTFNIPLDDHHSIATYQNSQLSSIDGTADKFSTAESHEQELSHEFILPSGLSKLLEESLTDALEILTNRGEVTNGIDFHPMDDISTMEGDTIIHDDGSTMTKSRVGQQALQSLLSMAKHPLSQSKARDAFMGAFLDDKDDIDSNPSRDAPLYLRDDLSEGGSDVSDLSENALSVAASAVGREALSYLISTSTTQREATTASSRTLSSQLFQSVVTNHESGSDESDYNSNGCHDLEESSIFSSAGRNALQNLLVVSEVKKDAAKSIRPVHRTVNRAPRSTSKARSRRLSK